MAIELMVKVWNTNLGLTDKMVMLCIADGANPEGVHWRLMDNMAARCSLTRRGLQVALKRLEEAGLIDREYRLGQSTLFRINLVNLAACEGGEYGSPPREQGAPGGANKVRPEPKPKNPQDNVGRATQIPVGWKPTLTDRALSIVDGWPAGKLDAELAQFIDHHRSKGNRFVDHDAAFRTWIDNAEKWRGRNERSDQGQPASPLLRAAVKRRAGGGGAGRRNHPQLL